MNKTSYIIIVFVLLLINVNAQQRMQYSTQVLQGFMQNPALVGIEKYHDVRLIYNQQWTGFDGAPTAKGVGFSSQIGGDTNTINSFKTLPLRGRTNIETTPINKSKSKTKKINIGWGGTVFSEGDGTININECVGMGALHFVAKKTKISLGIGLGLAQHQFNPNNIKLQNSYDATFGKQQHNIFYPTFQLGTMVYNSEYFVGFNTKQLVKKNFTYDLLSPDKRSALIAHTTLTAGLRLKAGQGITVTPSAIFRNVKNAPSTADINIIADYKDLIKVGFLYRTNGDLAGILGIIVNHKYSVNYAYDVTSSKLRNLYSNTHNLVVAVRLAKKDSLSETPVYFW